MAMDPSPSDSTTAVPTPTIQNLVSSVYLDCKLDLKRLSSKTLNTEYDPDRSSAVTMKIKNPKTTALIYASGKLVCTGAKSEEDSEAAARKFVRIIRKLGFPVSFTAFKIEKFVASCDVQFPIKLEKLACSSIHGVFSVYEPELYPGLIYRMKQPDASILIFASGKIVLAGVNRREDVYTAFNNIYPLLQRFSK